MATPLYATKFNKPFRSDTDTDASQPSSENSLVHTTIFYIGSESVGLTNLLMTHASSKVCLLPFLLPIIIFISSDPLIQLNISNHLESSQIYKLLMGRYTIVQKAKDADVFGILVGTLGVGKFVLQSVYPPSGSPLPKLKRTHHVASYLPLFTSP